MSYRLTPQAMADVEAIGDHISIAHPQHFASYDASQTGGNCSRPSPIQVPRVKTCRQACGM